MTYRLNGKYLAAVVMDAPTAQIVLMDTSCVQRRMMPEEESVEIFYTVQKKIALAGKSFTNVLITCFIVRAS